MTPEGFAEIGERIWWVGPRCTIHSDIVLKVFTNDVMTKQAYLVKHTKIWFYKSGAMLELHQKLQKMIEKEEKKLLEHKKLLELFERGFQ